MRFVYSTRVRFVDTDASGRIHFTAMLRHFEAAEQDFLRSIGAFYKTGYLAGVGFPRVHAECDYTGMVAFDDPLDIEVRVDRIGNSSYTLGYAATVDGRAVAHGKLVIVCIDLGTQKSRPIPEELAGKLRAYRAASPAGTTNVIGA
jgi:YbgC/YbaW family acyl-CoA thioester hydrolase